MRSTNDSDLRRLRPMGGRCMHGSGSASATESPNMASSSKSSGSSNSADAPQQVREDAWTTTRTGWLYPCPTVASGGSAQRRAGSATSHELY